MAENHGSLKLVYNFNRYKTFMLIQYLHKSNITNVYVMLYNYIWYTYVVLNEDYNNQL